MCFFLETYCSHKKNEKCIDDFEACTIDDECCSKFCSKGVNHTYTCNGDLNYVKKLVESGKYKNWFIIKIHFYFAQ